MRERIRAFLDDAMAVAPVFMREMRSRMRRPWAYWLMCGYTALLFPVGLYVLYRYQVTTDPFAAPSAATLAQTRAIGVLFAAGLLAAQFLLVSVLAPAITCGTFAVERAKRTLLFTLLTPLPTRQIVAEKLYFLLFYLVLLQLTTMPLTAISSLFGGISLLDLLCGYALLVAYAYLLGALGLYVSARETRTGMAALWSYLGVLAVPVIFPYLLTPFFALGLVITQRDPTSFLGLLDNTPTLLVAVVLGTIFWAGARWLLGETAAILDAERHLWGTYAPPLPVTAPPAPASAPIPDDQPPTRRRW